MRSASDRTAFLKDRAIANGAVANPSSSPKKVSMVANRQAILRRTAPIPGYNAKFTYTYSTHILTYSYSYLIFPSSFDFVAMARQIEISLGLAAGSVTVTSVTQGSFVISFTIYGINTVVQNVVSNESNLADAVKSALVTMQLLHPAESVISYTSTPITYALTDITGRSYQGPRYGQPSLTNIGNTIIATNDSSVSVSNDNAVTWSNPTVNYNGSYGYFNNIIGKPECIVLGYDKRLESIGIYSLDQGATWRDYSLPVPESISVYPPRKLFYLNNTWVYLSITNDHSAAIYSSPTFPGDTWTLETTLAISNGYGVFLSYLNDEWKCICGTTVYRGSSLSSLSAGLDLQSVIGGLYPLYDIQSDGTKYFILYSLPPSQSLSYRVLITTDFISYTTHTLPTPSIPSNYELYYFRYINGIWWIHYWLAARQPYVHEYFRSTDGITWDNVLNTEVDGDAPRGNLAYVDGIYTVTTKSSVLQSVDNGITWNPPLGTNTPVFNNATGIAFDSHGVMYVVDYLDSTISKVDASGRKTIFAGTSGSYSFNNGIPSETLFNCPYDILIDPNDNMYVVDSGNFCIRKISLYADTPMFSTFAGTQGTPGSADGILGTGQFYYPSCICRHTSGDIYVTDTQNHSIRKIDPIGNVSTYASGPTGFTPVGIDFDGIENLYVSDSANNVICKIDINQTITVVAGTGDAGNVDGPESTAQFNNPLGLRIDNKGMVYIADNGNKSIRMMSMIRGDVTTIQSSMKGPTNILLANNRIYFTDTTSVRYLTSSATVSAITPNLVVNGVTKTVPDGVSNLDTFFVLSKASGNTDTFTLNYAPGSFVTAILVGRGGDGEQVIANAQRSSCAGGGGGDYLMNIPIVNGATYTVKYAAGHTELLDSNGNVVTYLTTDCYGWTDPSVQISGGSPVSVQATIIDGNPGVGNVVGAGLHLSGPGGRSNDGGQISNGAVALSGPDHAAVDPYTRLKNRKYTEVGYAGFSGDLTFGQDGWGYGSGGGGAGSSLISGGGGGGGFDLGLFSGIPSLTTSTRNAALILQIHRRDFQQSITYDPTSPVMVDGNGIVKAGTNGLTDYYVFTPDAAGNNLVVTAPGDISVVNVARGGPSDGHGNGGSAGGVDMQILQTGNVYSVTPGYIFDTTVDAIVSTVSPGLEGMGGQAGAYTDIYWNHVTSGTAGKPGSTLNASGLAGAGGVGASPYFEGKTGGGYGAGAGGMNLSGGGGGGDGGFDLAKYSGIPILAKTTVQPAIIVIIHNPPPLGGIVYNTYNMSFTYATTGQGVIPPSLDLLRTSIARTLGVPVSAILNLDLQLGSYIITFTLSVPSSSPINKTIISSTGDIAAAVYEAAYFQNGGSGPRVIENIGNLISYTVVPEPLTSSTFMSTGVSGDINLCVDSSSNVYTSNRDIVSVRNVNNTTTRFTYSKFLTGSSAWISDRGIADYFLAGYRLYTTRLNTPTLLVDFSMAGGVMAINNLPKYLVSDSRGNLYIRFDSINASIWTLPSNGPIRRLVGSDGTGSALDGTYWDACFDSFGPMLVDPFDNIYVFSTTNGSIRKATPTGVLSTITPTISIHPILQVSKTGNSNQFLLFSADVIYLFDTTVPNNPVISIFYSGINMLPQTPLAITYFNGSYWAVCDGDTNLYNMTGNDVGFKIFVDCGVQPSCLVVQADVYSRIVVVSGAALEFVTSAGDVRLIAYQYDISSGTTPPQIYNHPFDDPLGGIASVSGMAMNSTRTYLYLADTLTRRIVRIELGSNVVSSYAGAKYKLDPAYPGGQALLMDGRDNLNNPRFLCMDAADNIYFLGSDASTSKIYWIPHTDIPGPTYTPRLLIDLTAVAIVGGTAPSGLIITDMKVDSTGKIFYFTTRDSRGIISISTLDATSWLNSGGSVALPVGKAMYGVLGSALLSMIPNRLGLYMIDTEKKTLNQATSLQGLVTVLNLPFTPAGISFDLDGNFYTLDTSGNRVVQFAHTGTPITYTVPTGNEPVIYGQNVLAPTYSDDYGSVYVIKQPSNLLKVNKSTYQEPTGPTGTFVINQFLVGPGAPAVTNGGGGGGGDIVYVPPNYGTSVSSNVLAGNNIFSLNFESTITTLASNLGQTLLSARGGTGPVGTSGAPGGLFAGNGGNVGQPGTAGSFTGAEGSGGGVSNYVVSVGNAKGFGAGGGGGGGGGGGFDLAKLWGQPALGGTGSALILTMTKPLAASGTAELSLNGNEVAPFRNIGGIRFYVIQNTRGNLVFNTTKNICAFAIGGGAAGGVGIVQIPVNSVYVTTSNGNATIYSSLKQLTSGKQGDGSGLNLIARFSSLGMNAITTSSPVVAIFMVPLKLPSTPSFSTCPVWTTV